MEHSKTHMMCVLKRDELTTEEIEQGFWIGFAFGGELDDADAIVCQYMDGESTCYDMTTEGEHTSAPNMDEN